MSPIILFLVAISFALIDPLVRAGWPDYYFRVGVSIMQCQMTLSPSWFTGNAQYLTQIPWTTLNSYSRFTFYEIEEGCYGLMATPLVRSRRNKHRSALCHGMIWGDQVAQTITLNVRLKFFAIGVVIAMVGFGAIVSTFTWFGTIWLLVVGAIFTKSFIEEIMSYQRLWAALKNYFHN